MEGKNDEMNYTVECGTKSMLFKKRNERKKSDEEPLVMHHTELKYLLDYDHSIGGN